ncbi:electron transport complex subunit E [Spirochaetia bacterium]|nr:electron transport complex subunit E [Spirochaetia bacterium]GHU33541.1 electron transport complex subunit E [Spirochaetia bacterium]
MNRLLKLFTNGLIRENPLLVLMIGLCSSLAVTTAVVNGIGMGLSMTFVLIMSEVVISLFRKLIPNSIRIPIFIIVIAAFTTVIDYVLKAWFPDLSSAMGVFIPLIVVNCIIMGRVEGFASKQPVIDCVFDAAGMGMGYTWVLAGIAVVRELLGSGSILGLPILPDSYQPILFFVLPPGGFFVFALFISLNLLIKKQMKNQPDPVSSTHCA